MLTLTRDEAEARAWLDELYADEIKAKRQAKEKSYNGEYDFY